MKLRRLKIERLPGIRHTLEILLPPDRVAVVIGPNASGKSSLIRALKALLERRPQKAERSAEVIVSATFEDQGRQIEGQALATDRKWRIDGAEVDRPDWPDADQLDAYLIRADDLIDPGRSEQQISAALKQTLSGGIDLDGLMQRAPFKMPSRPFGLKTRLESVDQAIRALDAQYARITADVDSLDRLQADHRQAAAAERRLDRVQRAFEWLHVRQQIKLTQTRLAQLPEGLDRLHGDEADTLDAVEQEAVRKKQQLQVQQSELKQARDALDQLRIDEIEQTQVWRDDLGTLQHELQQAEGRLREFKQQRAAAQTRLEQAALRSGGLSPDAIRELSADRLEQIERRIDALLQTRRRVQGLNEAIALRSQHAPDDDEADRTDQAIDLLRNWLALPPAGAGGWVVWSALLVIAAGAAVWFWQQQQFGYALISGVAALMPLSHVVQLGIRSYRSGKLKRALQALRLDPPVAWRPLEVRQRLSVLEKNQARTQVRLASLNEAEALRPSLVEAEQALADQQQALNHMADATGLKPDALVDAGLSLRLRNVYDWQQANTELRQLDNQIKVVDARIQNHLRTAQRCLQKIHPQHESELESERLEGLIQQIDHRLHQARELRQAIHSLEQSTAQTQSDIERLKQQRQQLFERAGLSPAQPAMLIQRLERLDEFRQAGEQLRGLEITAQGHAQALEQDAQLTGLVLNQDEAALSELQRELQLQADQREAIRQQIADIEHARTQALQERALETLQTERETLRQQLLEALDQHRMAAAGQFLLARIQDEQHQQHQPALLKRAMHWFARFTHSRYALKFDGRHFSAMDHQQGQLRSISELSTATRVQLKLALRLAWIDQLDRHRPTLPIVLDEVLATSDPERYRAVVEAAQELVREGRQVVYLSAQPMDADAWRHYADSPEPQIIELSRIDRHAGVTFVAPETRPTPDASLSPQQWARQAKVQPIDPWQAVQSIDLFHILRDRLAQLNDLRHRGIVSIGQLEHASALEQIGVDQALKPRVIAAKAWLRRWRLGQVRPLDSIALAESGLVSEHYIEGVTAICSHVNGNARALIDTLKDAKSPLKVAGFARRKTELLAQWLSEHGYLDEPQPAQDFELIDAMIQAASLEPAQANQLHGWLQAGLADTAPVDRPHPVAD